MDFIAPKKDLLRLVARCQGVADRKSAKPALANVLLVADGKTLRVAATDLYLGISGSIDVDVRAGGSIALPAKDLLDRIKAMPDGPIQFTSADGATVSLKAIGAARRYTLPGLPGADFPNLPAADLDASRFDIRASKLALLIARTHFSISDDTARPHINSALLEWDHETIRMVTTDGHRLSKMDERLATEHDAPVPPQVLTTMLIPLKAIVELRRLTEEAGDAMVGIAQSGPNAFFTIAGMVFSVKLVDAQFPPYAQVIPKSSDRTVTIQRAAFADSIRAVALSADEKSHGLKFHLLHGSLWIEGTGSPSGSGSDKIDIAYAGAEFTIGLNAKYILNVLDAIGTDEVRFGTSSDLDPCVITPEEEPAGQGFIGVLMPQRLK